MSLLLAVRPAAQEGNGLGKGSFEAAFDARNGAIDLPSEDSAIRCKRPREESSFCTASKVREGAKRDGRMAAPKALGKTE